MANLLAGASIIAQRTITAGIGPSAAAATYAASQVANLQPNQIANVGINAGFSLISGTPLGQVGSAALSSLTGVGFGFGGLSGGLKGTKPVALHTEYAGSKSSDSRPYSFTSDIVFFLLRADQSAPASAVIEDAGGTALAPASAQGGNFLGKALSSPWGQLATGVAINAALGGIQKATGKNSLVGPLTGLAAAAGLRAATGTGIFSQPAANNTGGSQSAVSNAVGAGPDAVATAAASGSSYWAPSSSFFTNSAGASFSGDPNFSPDVFNLPASSLGNSLGKSYPGITSNFELKEAINTQNISYADIPANLDLGLGSLLGAAAPLNEDATSIQSKDTVADIPKSWYFITAPQDVSWSKEGKVSSAETYGTNTPYVLYGATSLRKLTLGSVLLEGFSNRRTVEANIVALETCMNMVIQAGYTAPYCWKVYAGGKNYGTFVITAVKVKEVMRDLRGFAERAVVDIELQQVPDYQVNSGRDLASKAALGGVSSEVKSLIDEQNKEKENKSSDRSKGKAGVTAASAGSAGAQDAAASGAKTTTPSLTGRASRVQPGGQRGTIQQQQP